MLPLFIAIVLATLCLPPAQRLQRRGVPDGVAAAIVVIGALLVLTAMLAAIAPGFAEEISQLRPTIEDGIDSILVWLEDLGYDRDRLNELLAQAREQLSGSSSAILTGLAGGVTAALSGLAGIALLFVLLFFFVKDADDLTGWMVARLPDRHRDVATAVGRRAWEALSGYVRGTAAIAAIDAIAIGIGLAVIGVPLVLPLTVLVFLGAFLPVVGALLAGLIAVLVALADGGLQTALLVLALIVVVQQVEGNVLQPMIMRRAVALHPVVVLTALAIGATLAGIVGAFLSLPVAAVLAAVGNELRLRAEGDADGPSTAEPAGAG
jgi:predicted PurR-regulated permease PerM